MTLPSLGGQSILVTGATGFIGSHLALRLAGQGVSVRGTARSAAKSAWLSDRGVEIVEGDLADPDSLRRAVRGCSLVFSVAGWTGRPRTRDAPWRVNVDGTRSLVEAAIEAGAQRVVHTSSIAAYGPVAEGVVDESWPLRATDAYGASKAQSESIVFGCGDRIEPVVIRPAQVYGPRGGTWTRGFFKAVRRGLPLLIDGGHGAFHPCYIDNLVDAYLLAAVLPEAVGQAFTISDQATTWRDFVDYYARMAGRPARSVPAWTVHAGVRLLPVWSMLTRQPPIATPDMLSFVLGHYRYSDEKARRLLGWSPRVSLDEGMRRVEAWLRDTGRL